MRSQALSISPRREDLPWSNIVPYTPDPVFLVTGQFRQDQRPLPPAGANIKLPVDTERALPYLELQLTTDFQADSRASLAETRASAPALGSVKVGLTIGLPVDDAGSPLLFPSAFSGLARAVHELRNGSFHLGYNSTAGWENVRRAFAEYVLGAEPTRNAVRPVATIQTMGGANACRRAVEFLGANMPEFDGTLHLPDRRWVGWDGIARATNTTIREYCTVNEQTGDFDEDAVCRALRALSPHSVFVISPENPCGFVLSDATIQNLIGAALDSQAVALFDVAYHGVFDGPEQDARVFRAFRAAGVPTIIAYSGGKGLTLTGERPGMLFVDANSSEHARAIESFVGDQKHRPDYTQPPTFVAQAAYYMLTDPNLRQQLSADQAELRRRIHTCATFFRQQLRDHGLPAQYRLPEKNWGGIFMTLPWLTPERIARTQEFGTYMLGQRVTILAPFEHLAYAARCIVAAL